MRKTLNYQPYDKIRINTVYYKIIPVEGKRRPKEYQIMKVTT